MIKHVVLLLPADAPKRVLMDGQDIASMLAGIHLEVRGNETPSLVMELSPAVLRADVDGTLFVGEATAALLQQFGWTPPEAEVLAGPARTGEKP